MASSGKNNSDESWIAFHRRFVSFLTLCLHRILRQFPYCLAPALDIDPTVDRRHRAPFSHPQGEELELLPAGAARGPPDAPIPGAMEVNMLPWTWR